MKINAEHAIIAGIGSALIVGGIMAYRKHKKNRKELEDTKKTLKVLLDDLNTMATGK